MRFPRSSSSSSVTTLAAAALALLLAAAPLLPTGARGSSTTLLLTEAACAATCANSTDPLDAVKAKTCWKGRAHFVTKYSIDKLRGGLTRGATGSTAAAANVAAWARCRGALDAVLPAAWLNGYLHPSRCTGGDRGAPEFEPCAAGAAPVDSARVCFLAKREYKSSCEAKCVARAHGGDASPGACAPHFNAHLVRPADLKKMYLAGLETVLDFPGHGAGVAGVWKELTRRATRDLPDDSICCYDEVDDGSGAPHYVNPVDVAIDKAGAEKRRLALVTAIGETCAADVVRGHAFSPTTVVGTEGAGAGTADQVTVTKCADGKTVLIENKATGDSVRVVDHSKLRQRRRLGAEAQAEAQAVARRRELISESGVKIVRGFVMRACRNAFVRAAFDVDADSGKRIKGGAGTCDDGNDGGGRSYTWVAVVVGVAALGAAVVLMVTRPAWLDRAAAACSCAPLTSRNGVARGVGGEDGIAVAEPAVAAVEDTVEAEDAASVGAQTAAVAAI